MKKRIFKLNSLILVFLILVSSFSLMTPVGALTDVQSLPDEVDNSLSKYFPKIGSQGSQGACVCWAQVYYQFTYMMNRSMDVETTPENTFSTTFNYNFANGGRGKGTWEDDVYELMKEIGNVPLSVVPHNIEDYNNWYATEEIWQEAMKYRVKDYTIFKDIGQEESRIYSPDDPDLDNIKGLLAKGEILAATTYIYSWDVKRLKTNSAVPENDKYVNEYVIRFCDGTGTRHRVTIVGYNDNLWTDINNNGIVDSGEMGAFKIANSWGTDHHNKGYMWVAYDAINRVSVVSGCPTVNYRPETLNDITQIEVVPYDSDTDLYLRYTLNTCDRSQGKIYVTATKDDGTSYTFEVGPKKKHGMQNSTFSYDGTTNVNDGTMVWALRSIVPDVTSENLHEYSWSIKFEDTNADGKKFTVKNMEIVDDSTGRISKPTGVYPFTLDGSSKTVVFPQFEEYVPVTTTSVPTTVASTTEVSTPTQEVSSSFAETTVTEPETTIIPVETTVVTEPTEVSTALNTNATDPTVTTVIPTETTDKVTETTTVPKTYEEYFYGDANIDGNIKISDATIIQKLAANLIEVDKLNLTNADCNIDTKVNVKDATCIQKYLAKLSGFGKVGEKYCVEVIIPSEENTEVIPTSVSETSTAATETSTVINTDPTETSTATNATVTDPTEPTTVISTEPTTAITEPATTKATEASTSTVLPTETTTFATETAPVQSNIVTFTNSFGWQGTISCYYWSDSNQTMTAWPGVPMQNAGTNDFGEAMYSLEIPIDATYVIFTNGTVQTVDIPYSGGEQKFYPVSSNSEGKYSVENW